MNRSFRTLLGSTWAVLLLAAASAQADLVDWSYNWARTPATGVINADPGGSGGLTLTDEPDKTATGSSDIVATNIRTFSSADPNTPDTLTHKAYTLTLTITDTLSGQQGQLTFQGEFNTAIDPVTHQNLGFSASSANVTNTFLGTTSGTLTLGTAATGFRTYSVGSLAYTPPGPPTASNAGSISAHVSVTGGTTPPPPPPPPPPHGSPEPSTLLLSCLGLSSLGLATWRRWQGGKKA